MTNGITITNDRDEILLRMSEGDIVFESGVELQENQSATNALLDFLVDLDKRISKLEAEVGTLKQEMSEHNQEAPTQEFVEALIKKIKNTKNNLY